VASSLSADGAAKIEIIGRSDGETVRAMVDETQEKEYSEPAAYQPPPPKDQKKPETCRLEISNFKFYAYGVTVDDRTVLHTKDQGTTLERYFSERKPAITYRRTIASDGALAVALGDELKRRRIFSLNQIAIVSEWDTFYGQSFPATLRNALMGDGFASEGGKSSGWRRYGYLRGLDGQLPDSSADSDGCCRRYSSSSTDKNSTGAASSTGASPRERADGDSQFDYLRRLADRMRSETKQENPYAIGVLGSDLYDKLLIFRALRPQFPEAIFFTTDLDARLFDPDQSQWTRNILVASAYDLRLRGDPKETHQRDVPPFRDSYQTAAFLSTQLALHDPTDDDGMVSLDKAVVDCELHPPIFEIGRSQPFSLHREGEPSDSACASDPPYPGLDFRAFFAAAFTVAAVLAAVLFSFPQVRAFIVASPWRRTGALALGILALSVVLCLSWTSVADILSVGGLGQPIAWSEGISVWPVVFMRCVTVVLSIGLVLHVISKLDQSVQSLGEDFPIEPSREEILRKGWKWREVFSLRLLFRKHEEQDADAVADFWRTYVIQGHRSSRWWRVGAYVVAMLVLWTVIAFVFGFPQAPSRGSLSSHAYFITTTVEVVAMLFAIFFVVDATLLSTLFVRELPSFPSIWPSKTKDIYRNKLGIGESMPDDWIDVQFVARRTQTIVSLIYWPFLLIALLIFSRSSYFAAFTVHPTLVIGWGICVLTLVTCVLLLRWQAERVREAARSHLSDAINVAQGLGTQAGRRQATQLEMLLHRVETLQDGAFAPISQQPVVRALLLPLGSYGGAQLLQYMLQSGST